MRRAQQPQDCSRCLCCIFRTIGKYVKALEGIHIITKSRSHCRQWNFHFHLIKAHQHGADRRGCTVLPDSDDRGFHRDTVYCHFKSSAQHICCAKHGDRAVFPDHTDLIGRFIICFCKISSFDDRIIIQILLRYRTAIQVRIKRSFWSLRRSIGLVIRTDPFYMIDLLLDQIKIFCGKFHCFLVVCLRISHRAAGIKIQLSTCQIVQLITDLGR